MEKKPYRMVSSGMLRCVVLTRATWRNVPEDTIFHSHRCENLKSYKKPYSFHFFNPLTGAHSHWHLHEGGMVILCTQHVTVFHTI
jgi:hypothetical protein